MIRVIHLLPYDGIGGAEAAARSTVGDDHPDIDFEVRFIFPNVRTARQRLGTFDPLRMLATLRALHAHPPDILIASLWRACIVGWLFKMLRPRAKLVVLLHNSVDAHAADFVATRLALRVADAAWTDSAASVRMRFRRPPRPPVTLIPFLTGHLAPCAGSPPRPAFVFWGRLAAQKDIPRALQVFQRILTVKPDARFTVIGPDSGELAGMQALCERLEIAHAVRFPGPMDFDQIQASAAQASFYLQTSAYEGMAMSVVEAMQLGLVPVVTAVGEIASYCRDDDNAVLVTDTDAAAARVLGLLANHARYEELRNAAIETWRGHPTYRDAVLAQCRRLASASPDR